MSRFRVLFWNVNGIRAVYKKGFIDWFKKENSDILCIQETKAHPNQLVDDLKVTHCYEFYFSLAERKG